MQLVGKCLLGQFQKLRLLHVRFASNNRKLEPVDIYIVQLYRQHLLDQLLQLCLLHVSLAIRYLKLQHVEFRIVQLDSELLGG